MDGMNNGGSSPVGGGDTTQTPNPMPTPPAPTGMPEEHGTDEPPAAPAAPEAPTEEHGGDMGGGMTGGNPGQPAA